MLDLPALFREHRIPPRGVIHVGAHEGQELPVYREMGFARALLIEANPAVFARLESAVGGAAGVELVSCAICDREGTVELRVTSFDQSSSLLALKHHREVYPDIVESEVLAVPARRLDNLISERTEADADFNLLVLDVQGAELLVLRGAERVLAGLDAVVAEINFEELYEGCALADELDGFLAARGFERVATSCYHHPSWGDALYLRTPR
ncbi:MAG: FkbM family methyltransferase [Thermoanaerobaculia bacterium]|nr:MAG: FkbM family methyltransferase [Thermoanaerobaculia bacterium]